MLNAQFPSQIQYISYNYMNTANTMPSPATVTNPPFCDSNAGAPAVVALTAAPEVVDVDVDDEFVSAVAEAFVVAPVDEAFPLVDAFPLAVEFEVVLPVALAVAAAMVEEASVFAAFVLELWVYSQLRLGFEYLSVVTYICLSIDSAGCESNEEDA